MIPECIIDEFRVVDHASTDENAWGAAWNALLNEYFTIREGWTVAPQVSILYYLIESRS